MTGPLVTFSRHVDVPFEQSLAALERWRPTVPRTMTLRIRALEVPHDRPTRYRLAVRLGGPGRIGRPIRLEVRVTPWSEAAGTHLELLPTRRVRPTPRYFERCRALMDDLVAALGCAAGHACRLATSTA